MKNIHSIDKKRTGMALVLSLIVLLAAGVMVAVSLYFIENMATTTRMKTDSELRMNAALAGLEEGKQWILDEISAGRTPKLSSADIEVVKTIDDVDDLVDKLCQKSLSFTNQGIAGTVEIFDLVYEPSSDLKFSQGIPPRISVSFSSIWEESSQVQRQSYDSSNRGGGTTEDFATLSARYRAYLIRSSVRYKEIDQTVEQAVLMKRW